MGALASFRGKKLRTGDESVSPPVAECEQARKNVDARILARSGEAAEHPHGRGGTGVELVTLGAAGGVARSDPAPATDLNLKATPNRILVGKATELNGKLVHRNGDSVSGKRILLEQKVAGTSVLVPVPKAPAVGVLANAGGGFSLAGVKPRNNIQGARTSPATPCPSTSKSRSLSTSPRTVSIKATESRVQGPWSRDRPQDGSI